MLCNRCQARENVCFFVCLFLCGFTPDCFEKILFALIGYFDPLGPDIKMHIPLTVLHIFLMELLGRI